MESTNTNQEVRNWLDLPIDPISLIFQKLGAINILYRAQSVCSTWRTLAKDPHLFRSIDLRNQWELYTDHDIEKLAIEAIDRSCGQLIEFSIEDFATDELLHYMAGNSNSNSLTCLRLVYCYQVSNSGLIKAIKTFPNLEELEICYCSFSKEVIEEIGKLCPRLRYFRLDCEGYVYPRLESDEEAFAIAENMPQLRSLQLFGNKLTNNGLEAILDGCCYLEYLDLRRCFGVDLSGEFLKKCEERVKHLRFPNDSTHDYEYQETIKTYMCDTFSESDMSDCDDFD